MRYPLTAYLLVLRLYPSVPVNSRSALKTTVLPVGGGPDGKSPILVKKGNPVGYSPYVMHRLKKLYGSDANLFRPERWDPNEENEVSLKNIGWGYLPFNGGPRICLGRRFPIDQYYMSCLYVLQRNSHCSRRLMWLSDYCKHSKTSSTDLERKLSKSERSDKTWP